MSYDKNMSKKSSKQVEPAPEREYFIPELGVSVTATSVDEAIDKATKQETGDGK